MVDMKKVDVLSSLLRERSGLDVREAVVRFYSSCQARSPRPMIKRSIICLKRSVSR